MYHIFFNHLSVTGHLDSFSEGCCKWCCSEYPGAVIFAKLLFSVHVDPVVELPPPQGPTLHRFVRNLHIIEVVPVYIFTSRLGGFSFFQALVSIYFSVGFWIMTTLTFVRKSSVMFSFTFH